MTIHAGKHVTVVSERAFLGLPRDDETAPPEKGAATVVFVSRTVCGGFNLEDISIRGDN